MAIEGVYNLGGLEMDNCYVHVTRYQVRTNYTKIGDTSDYAKYLIVDYDYAIFKDKATALNNPTTPIKLFPRNRFNYQLLDGGLSNIWQIIYDDLGTKQIFRDFLPDEEE